MFKIGEFSALIRVSVKTLRYYDELGLLRPVRIDPESGYRFYSATQLPRLHRILALRDLGFPLDRVSQALNGGVCADALRGMLMLRQAEQEERLRQESERLTRLKALLRLTDEESLRAGEVVLKELPPRLPRFAMSFPVTGRSVRCSNVFFSVSARLCHRDWGWRFGMTLNTKARHRRRSRSLRETDNSSSGAGRHT